MADKTIKCDSYDCINAKDGTCIAKELVFEHYNDHFMCRTYKRNKKIPWKCGRCGGGLLDCGCI